MKLITKEKGVIFPCQPRNERKNKGLDLLDNINEPQHEISNNVVCATSTCSGQPAHTRSLVSAFASRYNIL